MHEPQVDRELCGQWRGSELGERQSFLVVGFAKPAAPLDEVTVHVSDECDGSAETDRSQACRVSYELTQGICRPLDSRDACINRY